MTLPQIEALIDLKGMPDAALAGEIRDRHLAFPVTRNIVDGLRNRGAGPEAVAALEALVPAPPAIEDFRANRDSLSLGESTTLRWSVSGAEQVSLSPGFGAVPPVGQRTLQPNQDIELTLLAEGAGGSTSRTIKVAVTLPSPPVIRSFQAEREAVKQGESVGLQWSVTGATRVRIDPGFMSLPTAGSIRVSPNQNTQYTLTAEGAGGSSTSAISVRVSPSTKDSRIREEVGNRATRLAVSRNLWRLIVPSDHAFHDTGLQVHVMLGFAISPIGSGVQFDLRVGNQDFVNSQILRPGENVDVGGEVWIQILQAVTNTVEFRVQDESESAVSTGEPMVARPAPGGALSNLVPEGRKDAGAVRLLSLVQNAMGGKAKLAVLRDWQQTAKVVWEPARSTSELRTMFVAPSTVREESVAGNRTVNYSNGQTGWSWSSSQPMNPALPNSTAAVMIFRVINALVLSDDAPERAMSLEGADAIVFSDRYHNSATLTIDPSTRLPRRLIWRNLDGAMLEETYSDWRRIGEVMWWFHMSRSRDGRTFLEVNVQNYRVNTGLTERDLSARPAR